MSSKSRQPSLKHSAGASSMLNFYINRAGETLPAKQERILEQAKVGLRKLFAKDRDRTKVEGGR